MRLQRDVDAGPRYVIGAGVGGVAGAALSEGSALGTVGGAVVGGVIGNQVGKDKMTVSSQRRRRATADSTAPKRFVAAVQAGSRRLRAR